MSSSKRISACNQAGARGLLFALVNIFMMLGSPQASAALGDVDPSFITGPGVNGSVQRMAWQADGKVLIAGSFTRVKGLARTNLARLNADGSGDASFQTHILPDYSPYAPYHSVRSIALQTNGQIIIAGSFTNVNGQTRLGLARLNADGSLDHAYHPGTGPLHTALLQPDGRLLIGSATVQRLNDDGSTDTSFNAGVPVTGALAGLFPNGQVLVKYACAASFICLSRRHADGTVDSGFSVIVRSDFGAIESVAIQPDGKIVVAGGGSITVDSNVRSRMMRLNHDGTFDSSFTLHGVNFGGATVVRDCVVLPDGRMLVCGSVAILEDEDDDEIDYYRGFLARLDANGSTDPGFLKITAGSPAFTVLAQPDGQVWLGGSFQFVNHDCRQSIARFQTNGLLDRAFNPDHGPTYSVRLALVQPDGKTIVGGGFSSGREDPFNFHGRLDRLNPDGSLDPTFNVNNQHTSFFGPIVWHPDGRLISGVYDESGPVGIEGLAFVEEDGTVDLSSVILVRDLKSITFQPDGKMLLAGSFYEVNGLPRLGVARLNTDGTVDSTFDPGINSYYVTCLLLQPDGKVLLGLEPNPYYPQFPPPFPYLNLRGLVRLNADGSSDATFSIGTGIHYEESRAISAMALQTNGQVLIAGNFTNYNGVTRTGLARLYANGVLDPGFNPVIWGDEYWTRFQFLDSVFVEPDGRILITGAFTNVNGVDLPGVARLNPDGSLVNEVSLGPLSFIGGVPGFDIRSVTPCIVTVEASTNLVNWNVVQSIPLSNAPVRFNDASLPVVPSRYYRLSW